VGRNNVAGQVSVKNYLGLFKLPMCKANRDVQKNTDKSSDDNEMAPFPKAPLGVQVGITDGWGEHLH
jgi:hypothetical protein